VAGERRRPITWLGPDQLFSCLAGRRSGRAQSRARRAAAEALARMHLYRQARAAVAQAGAEDQLWAYTAVLRAYAKRRDPRLAPLLEGPSQPLAPPLAEPDELEDAILFGGTPDIR
jgi:hypothetical protein